jgi:hypothetical protein
LYNIVHHKGDTITRVLETSPPNVTFRWYLIDPSLASWNVLLQRIDSIHLTQRSDEFRWKLHGSGKSYVHYMYKALIEPEVPIDNNNKKI